MDNNTTYTYIGGEITFGSSAINSGFGIDSSLVRYIYIENEGDKYDKYRDSVYKVITELIKDIDLLTGRVNELANNKIYEVKSVTLTNLRCDVLSSAKTIPATGGTFTITANSGYSLPNDVTVTGATSSWNKSTSELRIYDVIGEVTVSASAIANSPTSIKIYNATGTSELDLDQTIKGTSGSLQIKVNVTGDKTLIQSQSQFNVTEIPTGITVKNGSTTITKSTPLDSGTVLTISGNAVMSAVNSLTVTTTAKNISGEYISDSLGVKVEEGTVSNVDITTSDTKTSTYKGGNVTIALSVSETMFATPTISWSSDGGELQNKSISGATFVAPENTTTSDKVYTITAKYSDTLKDSMKVTVPAKPEDKKYYWYVGANDPTNMTSISPIVSDKTSPGWRYMGTSIPTYSKTNPLWNANDEIDLGLATKQTIYIALPSDNIKSRNDISGADVTTDAWSINSTKKTIGGINYTIWTSIGKYKYWSETLY